MFFVVSKYSQTEPFRSQGRHFGRVGSHLVFLCQSISKQEHERLLSRYQDILTWRHRQHAASVCAILGELEFPSLSWLLSLTRGVRASRALLTDPRPCRKASATSICSGAQRILFAAREDNTTHAGATPTTSSLLFLEELCLTTAKQPRSSRRIVPGLTRNMRTTG